MRILPVLDLLGGIVVRGIAGRRSEYRPLVSPLCPTSDPRAMASAFRAHFGLAELYLADLDAIAGRPPAVALYRPLSEDGFQLWVDAGLRDVADALSLVEAGVARLIAGLETLAGPDALTALCQRHGAERIVFSLDLKGGQPLARDNAWSATDAWTIAERAIECGVRSLIVLDLARVGVGEGTGTEELCRRLAQRYPEVELTAGGGVRGPDDLQRLRECGVHNVLVASALHDGRLTAADLVDL